jgi:hypothetical protein
MADEVEPLFHPETGEQLGWQGWNEDGVLVAMSLDGSEVTGAFNPEDGTVWSGETGEWSYPDELEADPYGGYGEAEVPSDITERMDALEARGPTYVPVPAEPDPEVQAADFHRQMEHQAAKMGRPFTASEVRAIGHELGAAEVAGEERYDVPAAIARLHERGQGLANVDEGSPHQRRAARQQLMGELLGDRQRLEAHERGEDDITQDQPPGLGAYNADDRGERMQYALDRLRGQADPQDLYSSNADDADDAALG